MKNLNSKFSFRGVNGKFLTLIVLSLGAIAGLGWFSKVTISELAEAAKYLGAQRIPLAESLGNVKSTTQAVPRYMWLALNQPMNSPERNKALENAKNSIESLRSNLDQIGKFQITDIAREQLESAKQLLPLLDEVVTSGLTSLAVGTLEQDKFAREVLVSKMPTHAIKLSEIMVQLSKTISDKNEAVIQETDKKSVRAMSLITWVSIACALSLFAVGLTIAVLLSKTLSRVSGMISESSTQVASASQQVSSASHELASTSAEQASAVEETSASLEEMSGMIENNVRNAESGLSLSESVRSVSERGGKAMQDLIQSMKEIMESNKRIENLVKVIDEIGEKTEIIDEIVFQTKLLSFNASVEAERAGEHGRGFAVVAQEVGNLAQMSGKAALEISGIVKQSVKDAQEIANENRERVEAGNGLVKEAFEILKDIQKNAETVVGGSKQILSASKEQSTGIRQITMAMENINKAAQEIAATSEESSAAGEELSAQAKHMDGLVGEMNQVIAGVDANVRLNSQVVGPLDKSEERKGSGRTKMAKRSPVNQNVFPIAKKTKDAPIPMKLAAGEELQSQDSALNEWEKL